MKIYTIYANSQGNHRAVKQGWSWPAFLFTWIWAMAKGLWALRTLSMGIFSILFAITFIALSLPSLSVDMNVMLDLFVVYISYAALAFSFIMGAKGNQWVNDSLLTQGYKNKEIIVAQDPSAAIALYLTESDKKSLMEA